MSADMIKEESKTYFHFCGQQVTLRCNYEKYEDFLKEDALKLYQEFKEFAEADHFTKTIPECKLVDCKSGMWFPNKESPFYNNDCAMLNTYNNLRIEYMEDDIQKIELIVFYDLSSSTPWCTTTSGRHYKLELIDFE